MKDETGMALYRKAGELNCPVGVMCFKGFGRHVEEIKALLSWSPQTKVLLYATAYFELSGPRFTLSSLRWFCFLLLLLPLVYSLV